MHRIRKYVSINKVHPVVSFILFGFIFCIDVSGQKATIREENISIKTYPYSDPNPIPSLAMESQVSVFYPYFVFDGYTDKGINREWKVVTLENDYISVTVLPEVGGKVMGAIEKSTGEEFIYLNHVLKFRSIGIRGPWTSGGIEHNFGLDLGHAPWTSSEVDYVLKENPDGSVSCVVGGLDLASRTQWRMNIHLPKDKAYFETRSLLYNPTPLHDAYLSWENAAYKATDDLQFYFPGTHHIGHGGDVSSWPFDKEGRNLSIYKENNFGTSKSYHVFGKYPNWYGGYYHDIDFGTGHWAPYSDAPGKKIWIWSLARMGAIWEGLLTDTDGQYIEAQSGVKFNQASPESGFNSPFNQLFMRPFYSETKTEYWFPVKETGGMVDATPNGTLNLVSSNNSLELSFCPNIPIHDSIIVKWGTSILYKELIHLEPMQVYKKSISLPEGAAPDIKVTIGQGLLSFTTNKNENTIARPIATPPGQDFLAAEHLFRQAEDMYSMREYNDALETYLSCIEKEPTHSQALAKVAELYYRRAQFEDGLVYASRALENNTYDPASNFIYGVIQRTLGNQMLAEEAFSVAVRSMEYRSAGYVEIAGLHLEKQNYQNAEVYANKALDYNRYNVTAYEFLGMAYRKQNKLKEAEQNLESLLEIDPLNHCARFERSLLNPGSESMTAFKSAIRNEFPHETYLELALEYANRGLTDEAIKVLEQSPEYPTVYYWLAYLYRVKSPEKSEQYLVQAAEMSSLMVFPFRLETIPVLAWAQDQHPSWKTNYYLGLIYWKILRTEKAKEYFEKCGNTPDFATFYIARGLLFKQNKFGDDLAGKDFKQAHELDPVAWRTWYYLSIYYQSIGDYKQELEISKQMFSQFPGNPVVGISHANSLLNSEMYNECLKVLENVNVLPQEHVNIGHGIYEKANLAIALDLVEKKKFKKAITYVDNSREWPENLGSGKPYEPDTRLQDYIAAHCEMQLGNRGAADNYYQHIIEFSRKHWSDTKDPANIYTATRVFDTQGIPQASEALIKDWEIKQDSLRDWRISGGSSSPQVQWVLAKYKMNENEAKKLEAGILDHLSGSSNFDIFLRAFHLIDIKPE
jgi:tetratricopeptide (TPR) repeat protein